MEIGCGRPSGILRVLKFLGEQFSTQNRPALHLSLVVARGDQLHNWPPIRIGGHRIKSIASVIPQILQLADDLTLARPGWARAR